MTPNFDAYVTDFKNTFISDLKSDESREKVLRNFFKT